MQINIWLTDKTPIWCLFEAGITLTEENKGPATLDLSTLNPSVRQIVINGLRAGKIYSDIDTQTIFEHLLGVPPASKRSSKEEDSAKKAGLLVLPTVLVKKTVEEEMLEIGSQKLRPYITHSADLPLINSMLKLEAAVGKRKTVLGWLHTRKLQLEEAKAKAWTAQGDATAHNATGRSIEASYISEVKEEDTGIKVIFAPEEPKEVVGNLS